MRFGVCGGPARFASCVASGAEYVEPAVAYDAAPEGHESAWAELLARLRDSGLTAEVWNCWLPGDLKIVGPQADWERYNRYVHAAIPRLAAAGACVVVFGSGGSRSIPDGVERARALDDFARAVRVAATAAAGAGIAIAVEALNARETNLLNSLTEASDFVGTLGLPNVKTTADLYHMEASGEGGACVEACKDTLGHAHVADAGREAPGICRAPIVDFMCGLRNAGYDGRLSIECNWHDFDSQVGPSLRFLRECWASVRASA